MRGALCLAILGAVTVAGQQFEVASARLNVSGAPRSQIDAPTGTGRLTITNMPVRDVILVAFGIQPFQLVAPASPVLTQRIDIVAKAETAAPLPALRQMLQPMLADRFKLVVRRETREMDALTLVVARQGSLGPKLKRSGPECDDVGTTTQSALVPPGRDGNQPRCGIQPSPTGGPGRIFATGLDMKALAAVLAPAQRRPVIDQTGLPGRYDIDVTYTPEIFSAASLAARPGAVVPPGVDPNGPSIFTALEDQLGLKLQSKRAPIEVIVIDRIEPLTPE